MCAKSARTRARACTRHGAHADAKGRRELARLTRACCHCGDHGVARPARGYGGAAVHRTEPGRARCGRAGARTVRLQPADDPAVPGVSSRSLALLPMPTRTALRAAPQTLARAAAGLSRAMHSHRAGKERRSPTLAPFISRAMADGEGGHLHLRRRAESLEANACDAPMLVCCIARVARSLRSPDILYLRFIVRGPFGVRLAPSSVACDVLLTPSSPNGTPPHPPSRAPGPTCGAAQNSTSWTTASLRTRTCSPPRRW